MALDHLTSDIPHLRPGPLLRQSDVDRAKGARAPPAEQERSPPAHTAAAGAHSLRPRPAAVACEALLQLRRERLAHVSGSLGLGAWCWQKCVHIHTCICDACRFL